MKEVIVVQKKMFKRKPGPREGEFHGQEEMDTDRPKGQTAEWSWKVRLFGLSFVFISHDTLGFTFLFFREVWGKRKLV